MFKGKSHLGNYSDKMLELDYNVGRIMDLIRAEAPDTIVVLTADNGAWQDAFPMPEPILSAARRAPRSKAAGASPASCGCDSAWKIDPCRGVIGVQL